MLTCIASSIVFGLLPAVHARDADPAESLNEGIRSTASDERLKLRNTLIACDVAISLVLLVGAGLMTKSFLRLAHVDPGFDPNRVLTLSVSLWGQKYSADAAVVGFYRDALDKIRAVPGVESAALTSQLPLGGNMDPTEFTSSTSRMLTRRTIPAPIATRSLRITSAACESRCNEEGNSRTWISRAPRTW